MLEFRLQAALGRAPPEGGAPTVTAILNGANGQALDETLCVKNPFRLRVLVSY